MAKKGVKFSESLGRRTKAAVERVEQLLPAKSRIGQPGDQLPTRRQMIPINVTAESGGPGDQDNPADWTYSVVNALNDHEIYDAASAQDPTSAPHMHTRPARGRMVEATTGEGFWSLHAGNRVFVIWRVFEEPDAKKCGG